MNESASKKSASNSLWPREIRGGTVTFITMAYILVVNPAILSSAGIPKSDVFFATCISSAVATILMGLYARYPYALAPGMGLNAFFAFTVCLGHQVPWQAALAAVLLSGVLFVVLSLTGLRTRFLESVPPDLGRAIAAGIGLFIAFIGLQHTGLVVQNDATMISFGSLRDAATLIALAGLMVTIALVSANVRGAILIGMAITTAVAAVSGAVPGPSGFAALPKLPEQSLGAALYGAKQLLSIEMLPIVFTMLFVDMFDTMGTLLALGHASEAIQPNGTLPRANRAFLSDAVGTITGALLGTSTVTTYIESSAGIVDGARTGRAAVVTGVLFLLSLFLFPLFSAVPAIATGPALVVVGTLMFTQAAKINWKDTPVAISAALTMLAMPVTYSISTGIGIGFITYTIAQLSARKPIKLPVIIISALFTLYFAVHEIL